MGSPNTEEATSLSSTDTPTCLPFLLGTTTEKQESKLGLVCLQHQCSQQLSLLSVKKNLGIKKSEVSIGSVNYTIIFCVFIGLVMLRVTTMQEATQLLRGEGGVRSGQISSPSQGNTESNNHIQTFGTI